MLDGQTAGNLISFFEKLLKFYREFLKLEEEKYEDLKGGRLDRLDGHLNREQACVLRARGLEQERQKLLTEAGEPETPFRDLIPQFPAGLQEKIRAVYGDLSSVLLELEEAARKNERVTKRKLRLVSEALGRLENHPELRKAYGEKAEAEAASPGILSKKI